MDYIHPCIGMGMFVLFVGVSMTAGYVVMAPLCPPGCACEHTDTMVCQDNVPREVPQGVTHVTIVNNLVPLNATTFSHPSWCNVNTLDITEEDDVKRTVILDANTFTNLINLESLGLHLNQYRDELDSRVFYGLDKLLRLDMSGCFRLQFDLFKKTLLDLQNFPNLDTLDMTSFNEIGYGGQYINLSEDVFTALGERKLKHLVADSTRINDISLNTCICSSLESVSFRDDVIIGSVNVVGELNACTSLKRLDSTRTRSKPFVPFVASNITINQTIEDHSKLSIAIAIEELIVDSTIAGISFRNSRLIINAAEIGIRHLSIRGNNLRHLDLSFDLNANHNMSSISMADNEMEFISSEFFRTLGTLLHLDLSNNKLGIMASTSQSKFETLLVHMPLLDTVDLSKNSLSYVSSLLFKRNTCLRYVSLSGNNLAQFYQSELLPLIYMDMSGNDIVALDERSRHWLDDVYRNTSRKFSVNLNQNRFECRCDTLDFLDWFLRTNYVTHSKTTTQPCLQDATTINVTQVSVDSLRRHCEHPALVLRIVLISCTSCVAFLVLSVSTACLYRSRQRKKNLRRRRKYVVECLQNGTFWFELVAFLAHSSEDDDIVLNHIYPEFVAKMKEVTGTEMNLVSTGDSRFWPGFGLLTQTQRVVTEECAVVVAVISRAFCNSQHCREELDQAHRHHKPIVLVFVEEVDERDMGRIVHQLFTSNVRVQYRMEDGEGVVTPSWDLVCTSVLELIELR